MISRLVCLLLVVSLMPSCVLLREEESGPRSDSSIRPWNEPQPGDQTGGQLGAMSAMNRY